MIAIKTRRIPVRLVASSMLLTALALVATGCGGESDREALGTTTAEPKRVIVTASPVVRQPIERSIEVVGTLFGWEEVTIGSKQTGRVLAVRHDLGDRVEPGEALVQLDPVDANFALEESQTRLLGELVKLGLSSEEAGRFVDQYGIDESILQNTEINVLIDQTPSVKQAQSTLDLAESRLNRQRQLAQRSAGTIQELQDAEGEREVSSASLDTARMNARTVIANALSSYVARKQATEALREMTIEAPRPSVLPPGTEDSGDVRYAITRRHVSEGQFIRPGDPVVDLVLEDPLRLRANVPERFEARIAEDQVVEVMVAARPGETFPGTVARINPRVDPVSRTFEVEALVPNDALALRPGSFAKARIVTRREDDATLVPIESVVRFAGVVKIFLLDPGPNGDGWAREQQVRTGSQIGELIEIIGGLPEGSAVITSGQSRLADGSPVVLRDAPSQGTPDAPDSASAESTEHN